MSSNDVYGPCDVKLSEEAKEEQKERLTKIAAKVFPKHFPSPGPERKLTSVMLTQEVIRVDFYAPSQRGKDWIEFAKKVLNHIEHYTVPQYGDKPDDQVEEWSPEECMLAVRKYAARMRSNSRDNQTLLDMIKSAHYCQLAHDKLEEETKCTD